MVYLSKIYTRTGDAGTTKLVDGTSVSKTDARMQACGSVDECGAILGMVMPHAEAELQKNLLRIQNDLFDLGSDLATPLGGQYEDRIPRIQASQVAWLEGLIDAGTAQLEPLKSFILAGGTQAASWLHLGRTVARRAERHVVSIGVDAINSEALKYLNRLSDYLFVAGRLANNNGQDDVLWVPGANR